jgi:hypothetical protein
MRAGCLFRVAFASMIAALLCTAPVTATGPSLSGNVSVNFVFVPGDQSYWAWSNATGSLTLSIPSTIDTSIKASVVGPATLNWSTPGNWTQPALDTSGVSVGQTGSGTFDYSVNFGSPTLDVFRGFGPGEDRSTFSEVDITHASGAGEPLHYPDFATVQSNFASSKFNVTIPSGASVHNDQFEVTVENLIVQSGGNMLDPLYIVRHNLTNHGSGNFGGTVQGNFINDALSASGNIASVSSMVLQGQLQNTGELKIPGVLETDAATSNAGSIFLNLGQIVANAPFINSGSISTSGNITIRGTSSFTNNGVFQWNGGIVEDGSGFINNSSSFSISGPDTKTMFEPFLNTGKVSQSGGGDLALGHGQTLTNQAGALFDITDDSTISAGFQGGVFANAGTLRKSGGAGTSSIGVPLTNTGTIAVNSGTLSFTDALSLDPAGKLAFQLRGTTPASQYGKLNRSGNLTLAGTLQVTLGPGFMPALGNSFDLIDWGGQSGAFSALQLPFLVSGLKWDTSQLYTNGVLSIAAGIPGDYNQNGVVDAADYTVWRDRLGTTYTQADYNIWKANFGNHSGSGASATTGVPEPATLWMLLAGILTICCFQRARVS